MMGQRVYRRSTIIKYKTTEKHLLDLQWQNAGRDIFLVDLSTAFVSNGRPLPLTFLALDLQVWLTVLEPSSLILGRLTACHVRLKSFLAIFPLLVGLLSVRKKIVPPLIHLI